MRQILFAIIFGTLSTAFGASNIPALEADIIHGQYKGFTNAVKNPTCRRNGVSDITSSSVAPGKNTSDPLDGISDCTWNPTASTQTIKFALKNVPRGIKNGNCEARISYYGDASLVKAYVERSSTKISSGGTNGENQLTNAANSTTLPMTFNCGDNSATTYVVLESTGDAASAQYAIYAGENTNIGTVAQAQVIGKISWALTANCIWTNGTTTLANLAVDTDCATPTVTGNITAPSTKIAAFTINSGGSGTYIFRAVGGFGMGTAGAIGAFDFSDGTSVSETSRFMQNGSGVVLDWTSITGSISYSAPFTNKQINIRGAASSGNAELECATAGMPAGTCSIEVLYIPSQSQQAVLINTFPWRIEANISGANPSLGTANVSTATEIVDAGLTMTPLTGSQPVGIVCSSTNAAATPASSATTCAAGSEGIGAAFNIPKPGTYKACLQFTHYASSGGSSGADIRANFTIVETPTNAQTISQTTGAKISSGIGYEGSAAQQEGYLPVHLCSFLKFDSVGTKAIRLMYEQLLNGGASVNANSIIADANTSAGNEDIYLTVEAVDQQFPTPIITDNPVYASYWVSTNFTASTTIPINFDSKETDSHNAVTTSATAWKFTAPYAGNYIVHGACGVSASSAWLKLYKNGSVYKMVGASAVSNGSAGIYTTTVRLLAGDYIDLRPQISNTITGGALSADGTCNVNIEKITN